MTVRLSVSGKPLAKGTPVRAVILQGDARLTAGLSADLITDESGAASVAVFPGTRAGPLVIRFDVGDASAEVTLALTADIRKPLVVGYATGGMGPVPGWIEASDGAPSGTNTRRGAISLFGTGKIAGNTRGTFAYDSGNTLEQSLQADPFLDNPNDRPFPTYGDASTRYDDALSTNHYFASIQNGRSSAMYGQFYAHAAPSGAVGGYNVLVNGAQVLAGGNNVSAGLFTARNNIAYARAVLLPTGLAVPSQALHPDIVIGSDIVTLVHLDRRTGAVLSQSILVRGNDYVLDYGTGLLRFLNIILPYDDALNPQIVVVQYQYGGPGATSTMFGGNATAKVTPSARLDAWYLNDSIGSGNLTFLGESLGGGTPNTTWSFSHEHSQGYLPITTAEYGSSGEAFAAAFATHSDALRLSLGFSSADAAYNNPFGSYTASGLTSFNALVGVRVSRISELQLTYTGVHNILPETAASQEVNNTDSQLALTLRVKPSHRLQYHVGVDANAASSNGVVSPVQFAAGGSQTPNAPGTFESFLPSFGDVNYYAGSGHSINLDAGATWQFSPQASIGLTRIQPLSSSFDPYNPPQTLGEFDLNVGPNAKLFVRQLWQQSPSQSFAATQTGQTFASTAQSQTSIGFEDQVGPTTYQTGYAVEHTASGTDLYDAIGMRTTLKVSPRFNLSGFAQAGTSLYATYASNTSPYFLAAGTGLDYSIPTFHASAQAQVRAGFNSGSSFNLGATGPISPAVSLYASYTGSYTIGVYDTEGRGGLAYRPSRNDRYVTLVSVDAYRSSLTNYNAYNTNVAQIQELYRSSSRTEWAGSLAYKLTGDSYFAPRTTIFGLRGDQRIGSRFDVASEVHWSDIAPISGTNATGLAVEAGYRLGSSWRVAGGYNFAGFADPETAINPTHQGLYVTLSAYIDRFFGWGRENP